MKFLAFKNLKFFTGTLNESVLFLFNNFDTIDVKPTIIVHINLFNYYQLRKLSCDVVKELKNKCVFVFDGIGLKIAFLFKGFGLLPDLNGTDLFPLAMNACTGKNFGFYFLGGTKDVNELAVANVKKRYPLITICGNKDGYFPIENEESIVDDIIKSGAQILLVSMGFPLQEQFCIKHYERLKNFKIIWNVGGLFDFLSLKKKRAPFALRIIRLEWLYRLFLEPRRMVYRNTVAAAGAFVDILFKK